MNAADVPMKLSTVFPMISKDTGRELESRDLVTFQLNRWRFGDRTNGTTRNLRGRRFVRSENKGADWHKLIGLADVVANDRPFVILVTEGSKDGVAGLELANRAGLPLSKVGICVALGAGYRPIPSEIQQLRGRKVLVVGDRDAAGMKVIEIVSHALTEHGVDHAVWNWNSFDRRDGKDLFQLLNRKKENSRCSYDNSFLFFSPSYGSTVQQFNGSTHSARETDFSSSTHILTFVEPFVVTEQSTGNRRSFELARAVRMHEETTGVFLGNREINEIFHRWFAESRPFLKTDADEQKSCAHFYMQMRRVRYLSSDLDAACDRARTLSPPQIPGLDTVALKVAALMRELQGNAGGKSFIAPINVIVRFASLHPEQARRILFVLERRGVIECVQRGAPRRLGRPGKSTIWRYSLIEGVAR